MISMRSRLVSRFDIARYDGMPLGKLDVVLAQATAAGLIVRHSDDPEMVTLTAAGATAVREKIRSMTGRLDAR